MVSALFRRHGTNGDLVRALRDKRFDAIYTIDSLIEIIDVLGNLRLRLKYHIESDDVVAFISLIRLRGDLVTPERRVVVCSNPKDDKFLEAALAGNADCVVSGTADLLDLTSFEDIPILRPAEFFTRL